jgi:hypothetical protein
MKDYLNIARNIKDKSEIDALYEYAKCKNKSIIDAMVIEVLWKFLNHRNDFTSVVFEDNYIYFYYHTQTLENIPVIVPFDDGEIFVEF